MASLHHAPWKKALFHGLTRWSNIHGLILKELICKVFGPLIRYKLNVDQEERSCTKNEYADFFFIYPKKEILKERKFKFNHSLVFSCLHFLFPKQSFIKKVL